jgi:hypothetical protein
MKIRPVGAELFHADGWTDMMKLIVDIRNLGNGSKKGRPYVTTIHVPLSVNSTKYQQLILLLESVKRKVKTMTCMIRIPSDYNTQGSER